MKIIIFIFEIVLDSSNAEILLREQTEFVKIWSEILKTTPKKKRPRCGRSLH